MTAKPHELQTTGVLAPTVPAALLDLTLAANRIAGQSRDVNSYQLRNQLLTREEKRAYATATA